MQNIFFYFSRTDDHTVLRLYDLFILLTLLALLAHFRGCGIFMIQDIHIFDSWPLFFVRYRSHAKDHKRLLIVYGLM